MRKSKNPLFLAIPLMTAACGTTPTTGTIGLADTSPIYRSICQEWRSISFSASKDTKRTVDEIRGNNAAREEFCKKP
jgi:hypothetical protein